jgi:hypothetical protein
VTDSLSLAELSDLFTEMGAELDPPEDPDAVLTRLTALATRQVPGAEYAGVTLGHSGGRFTTVAATDEVVTRVDQIQYELGSGPCVDALLDDMTYSATDLRVDPRWTEFGRRAVEHTGIMSMLSFRLYHERNGDLITGLNMYSRVAESFDKRSETIGLLLATHGALAAERAAAQHKADNLAVALQNSREIGVAMGILMNAGRITKDQAFDLLRIASQHTHRKLSEVATEVAETGLLPSVPNRRS